MVLRLGAPFRVALGESALDVESQAFADAVGDGAVRLGVKKQEFRLTELRLRP